MVDDGFATHDDIPEITARPIYGREFPRHSAQDSRIRFDYAMRTLGLMHDAGVKISEGSDVALLMPSRPVALLRELHLLAKAGLSPTRCCSTPTPAFSVARSRPLGIGATFVAEAAGSPPSGSVASRNSLADRRNPLTPKPSLQQTPDSVVSRVPRD